MTARVERQMSLSVLRRIVDVRFNVGFTPHLLKTAQCALSRQTIRRNKNEIARFPQRDAVGFLDSSDIRSRMTGRIPTVPLYQDRYISETQ